MNKDLTIGKPSTVLWQFCLPLFGSIIFQQLYNIADSLVAGKFIGEDALAAVGNSYEITLIFIAFAFGTNVGCSVIVGQLFGAKRFRELKTAVYTTLIAGGVLCAVLMAGGFLLSFELLHLINTPENVMADSKLYLDIYMLGLPFVFYYNIATGVFSALGDSKTPFLFLATSSTANIAVDILFVTAFQMGVAGVAWATFLCQGVSCVLAVVVVFRRFKTIGTAEKAPIFSWHLLKRIAVVAVPSILQQSFISVGNILIQGIINSFGSAVMAGYSASIKLNNLVISSFTTLGNGISNYTAQNLGAHKFDRIHAGQRSGLKLVWLLYGQSRRRSDGCRNPVPADRGTVLLRGICKAGDGRCSPGQRHDAAVHDCHVLRPDPPGGAGKAAVRNAGKCRHLACLAYWLDSGNPHVPVVL